MQKSASISKEEIFDAYGWRCAVSLKEAHDLHHVKAQTQANRKRWPLFIDSPFNLIPINRGVHMNSVLPSAPSDRLCDIYEKYLQSLLDKSK